MHLFENPVPGFRPSPRPVVSRAAGYHRVERRRNKHERDGIGWCGHGGSCRGDDRSGHCRKHGERTTVHEENLDCCPEERLIELARKRKKSFVAKLDEIISLTIDAPSSFGRLFADSTLAGWITLRDKCLGKIILEIHDQPAMAIAVEKISPAASGSVFTSTWNSTRRRCGSSPGSRAGVDPIRHL